MMLIALLQLLSYIELQKLLLVSTIIFRIPSGSVSFLRLLAEFLSEFSLIFI